MKISQLERRVNFRQPGSRNKSESNDSEEASEKIEKLALFFSSKRDFDSVFQKKNKNRGRATAGNRQ